MSSLAYDVRSYPGRRLDQAELARRRAIAEDDNLSLDQQAKAVGISRSAWNDHRRKHGPLRPPVDIVQVSTRPFPVWRLVTDTITIYATSRGFLVRCLQGRPRSGA